MSGRFTEILADSPSAFIPGESLAGTTVGALVGGSATMQGTGYSLDTTDVGLFESTIKQTSSTGNSSLRTALGASAAWTTFTVSGFFVLDSLSAACQIMSKGQYFAGDNAQFPMAVSVNTNGSLSATLSYGGDFTVDATLLTASGLVSVGTPFHAALVVRASGLCELVINGVQRATATLTSSVSTSAHPFAFGGPSSFNGGGVGSAICMVGRMAGLAVFPTALSVARLAAHTKILNPTVVTGVVRDAAGALAARSVRINRRDTGDLIGSGTSNAGTGVYSIPVAYAGEVQRVVVDNASSGTIRNDLIDRLVLP